RIRHGLPGRAAAEPEHPRADRRRPAQRGERPRWRDRRPVQERGAPDGGEDRAAREGFFVQISDDQHFEEHLMDQLRPSVQVAVVMEREAQPNRWEEWRFKVVDVVSQEEEFGLEPRVLRDDGKRRHMLYPGFTLELFRDEAEGYHLNLTSGSPVWFVMWRVDDADPSQAQPEMVSLSYNEAGRWLDAQ